MTEELQKKAEDFIIERYKIAECYREDNVETREYMRMDVHSQYEEEYKLYLDATKELEKENAELNNFIMQSKKDGISPINALIIKNLGNQLTKAKEIIENLLYYVKQCTCERSNYAEIEEDIKEAEQFLSEVEE